MSELTQVESKMLVLGSVQGAERPEHYLAAKILEVIILGMWAALTPPKIIAF